MGRQKRVELCNEIEAHRHRPLIIYATNKRQGAPGQMAMDVMPFMADQLSHFPADTKAVDVVIAGLGGDPMVSWRIMSSLRERVDDVAVLVPQSAYSAATLLALGANQIIMHPNANLGPIDIQISGTFEGGQHQFSTEDVEAFLDFVRDRLGLTDQEHLRRLFEMTCKEVGTLGVGLTARSSKLAAALGEKLLGMHMKEGDQSSKRKALVENLSRQFYAHAYPVSRTEAIQMGLAVNKERDEKLEDLMWRLWLDLEEEFMERWPFHPMTELLSREPVAKVLLSPVPQWNLPPNLPIQNICQTNAQELEKVLAGKANLRVEPVPFQIISAIMESTRLAYRFVSKGQILASRLPDLNVQFKCLTASQSWEKV
jgi:ATP-dependent protease ClpP protease subunit